MRASGAMLRIPRMRAPLHTRQGRIRSSCGRSRIRPVGVFVLWLFAWVLLLVLTIFSLGGVSKSLDLRAFLPLPGSRAEDPPVTSAPGRILEEENHVYYIP